MVVGGGGGGGGGDEEDYFTTCYCARLADCWNSLVIGLFCVCLFALIAPSIADITGG